MTTVLECRGLGKSFRVGEKRIDVLKDIGFSVAQNEIVVISGKSGEGKTVLLWLLALLDTPTSGTVLIDGAPTDSLSVKELTRIRRGRISLIFQDFNLVSSWTALENVTAALAGTGLGKREQKRRGVEILESMGLGDRLSNLPAELSIGQRQRVAIARSMIVSPGLILADEPTGGVDPETGKGIIDLLAGEVKNGKAAMVVATHGGFPLDVADRVHYLKNGMLS
jgi:putative ABC transport system ATP-binding protein